MKRIIELGKEYFYVKMSDYMLSDWTMKVETRINKVKIKAHYEEVNKPDEYSFNIWNGHFSCQADALFETLDEANEYAELLKNKIEVIVVDSTDDSGDVKIWPKK